MNYLHEYLFPKSLRRTHQLSDICTSYTSEQCEMFLQRTIILFYKMLPLYKLLLNMNDPKSKKHPAFISTKLCVVWEYVV